MRKNKQLMELGEDYRNGNLINEIMNGTEYTPAVKSFFKIADETIEQSTVSIDKYTKNIITQLEKFVDLYKDMYYKIGLEGLSTKEVLVIMQQSFEDSGYSFSLQQIVGILNNISELTKVILADEG